VQEHLGIDPRQVKVIDFDPNDTTALQSALGMPIQSAIYEIPVRTLCERKYIKECDWPVVSLWKCRTPYRLWDVPLDGDLSTLNRSLANIFAYYHNDENPTLQGLSETIPELNRQQWEGNSQRHSDFLHSIVMEWLQTGASLISQNLQKHLVMGIYNPFSHLGQITTSFENVDYEGLYSKQGGSLTTNNRNVILHENESFENGYLEWCQKLYKNYFSNIYSEGQLSRVFSTTLFHQRNKY
jgi:hypothetical protein